MTLHLETSCKRQIGQILLDGGFVTKTDLKRACEEQKRSGEPLGQVLVRLGVLQVEQLNAPLLLQPHLCSISEAAHLVAGERQLLGKLLVESGKISKKQFDAALAEQKRSGEKLGQVFVRLGVLTQLQLQGLLEFQFTQAIPDVDSPLRLGELLVSTGQITREQLTRALARQHISHKKIGQVLLEQGALTRSKLQKACGMQRMLLRSVLASILALGSGAPALASTVTLHWNPSVEATAGYKVYYSDLASALTAAAPVDVKAVTATTIDGLDPGTSYQFAVTAYDTSGTESGLSNIVIKPEQVPPVVELNAPASGSTVSGVVNVTASASDNVGVTKVEFYVNSLLAATETAAPYSYSWDTTILPQGSYTIVVKAYDAAGNFSQANGTVQVVNDTVAPVVALTSPGNGASLRGTVTVSCSASDNVGVSSVQFLANGVPLYSSNLPPYSFSWDTTKFANGSYAIAAVARDNAGNSTQSSAVTVTVDNAVPDVTAPSVVGFALPATATSLTVPITQLSATDAVGVTGYLVSASATPPQAADPRWSGSAPASVTFSAAGSQTAYAWAKDAAGNVSSGRSATVVITLPDIVPPTVVSFAMPASSTSVTVPVTSFSATNSVGVTGYLISESSTPPLASDTRWRSAAPTSFTFAAAGTRTAYAWAKDAAGKVSSSRSATVVITLPGTVTDTVAPTIVRFRMPSTSSTLTVPVTRLRATDAVGVTGYLISESPTPPLASDPRWSSTAPTSFTFASFGTRTAYVWARDAAGNVSAAVKRTVTIYR